MPNKTSRNKSASKPAARKKPLGPKRAAADRAKPAQRSTRTARPDAEKRTSSARGPKSGSSAKAARQPKASAASTKVPLAKASAPRIAVAAAAGSSKRNNSKAHGSPSRKDSPPAAPAPNPVSDVALAKVHSGLTHKEIEEFRTILLQKRAELTGDVRRMRDEALSKDPADLSNMPQHMADAGTDNYEQELTLGLIESERNLLREIEDALERIRRGTYGVCAATAQPIGKARLRGVPWAKFSYEYVLAQERGRRPRM